MNKFGVFCSAVLFAASASSGAAIADDRAIVQKFYDFLSNPSSELHAAALKTVVAEDWKSIGDYSGLAKTREKFIAQVGGFGQLIPDLDWAVQEMLQDGDRVIVRGRAKGTPKGPMFGVDGGGKSFDIMSIDIHTVKNGVIVETYHVEDWAGAIRQLKGQ